MPLRVGLLFCLLLISGRAYAQTGSSTVSAPIPATTAPPPTPPPAPTAPTSTPEGRPSLVREGTGEGRPPRPEAAEPPTGGVYAEFGRGITMRSSDGAVSLAIRARLQVRGTVEVPEEDQEEDPAVFFQARRMRLVFLAEAKEQHLQLYVQLGIAPADMEADLLVPLRDATIIWTGLRDLSLKAGQMKVPFNRERVISSSALQFADRSNTNAELTLDRDVGLQFFSNDLFGLGGILGYQAGVFSGDGRNRFVEDYGLLYVVRLQAQPLGRMDDAYAEADLTREERPRLSLGLGGAYNQRSRRQRSTHGAVYRLEGFDQLHAEADLIFKYAGLSVQTELLLRKASEARQEGQVNGFPVVESSRSGLGYMVQVGYVLPNFVELALRWSDVKPLPGVETTLQKQRDLSGALGWYASGHDLKIQADYTYTFGRDFGIGSHLVRTQIQVYF
ncbi:MAG: porin [Deltaproteobacteria bacterium]|nr:porin [Deltaproteobacteria bacterium]